MDFAAIMLSAEQIIHLKNFILYLRLLLFRIKSQPGVAYKNVA